MNPSFQSRTEQATCLRQMFSKKKFSLPPPPNFSGQSFETLCYAGFWVRLLAYLFDSLLLWVFCWGVEEVILSFIYGIAWILHRSIGDFFLNDLQWIFLKEASFPESAVSHFLPALLSFEEAFHPIFLQVLDAIVYLFFTIFLSVYVQYWCGTTPGKRIFRIYVVNEKDYGSLSLRQSWVRFFSYGLSYLPFATGFLMVISHPKKRGLHDLIARTVSVVRPKES